MVLAGGCGRGKEEGRVEAEGEAAPGAKSAAGSFTVLGPDDRALPAGVAVYRPGEHEAPVWEGLAGETYALEPGDYDVLVEYFGQKYWHRGVALAGGEASFKLPMGTLAVDVRSSRGDRLTGEVALYPPGETDDPPLMQGETFEGLAVLAGTYDVRVMVQGRERWLRDVAVEAGDREERTLLEPVGYLSVDVVDQDGEALEAEVWVYGPASARTPVATGKTGRPLALLPGRYDVAVRWAGTRDYSAGVAVMENRTTVERFTFFRSEAS
jgi:hypothetical protein